VSTVVVNVGLADFVEAVAAGDCTVIDVREHAEYLSGHVPGALFIPLHVIPLRESEIASGSHTFVICESGARASQAATFLDRKGIEVRNVEGGMVAWRAAGLAMVRGE
jgi:rhodanese-related sulfurtransferase